MPTEGKKHKYRVLVVDDEKEMRLALRKILTKAGYQVRTAPDGIEGLKALGQEKSDIILLDVMMPKLNGIETLRVIKSQYKDVVVIMITANGELATAREVMRLKAYDYIKKPFDMDMILKVIKQSISELNWLRGAKGSQGVFRW